MKKQNEMEERCGILSVIEACNEYVEKVYAKKPLMFHNFERLKSISRMCCAICRENCNVKIRDKLHIDIAALFCEIGFVLDADFENEDLAAPIIFRGFMDINPKISCFVGGYGVTLIENTLSFVYGDRKPRKFIEKCLHDAIHVEYFGNNCIDLIIQKVSEKFGKEDIRGDDFHDKANKEYAMEYEKMKKFEFATKEAKKHFLVSYCENLELLKLKAYNY